MTNKIPVVIFTLLLLEINICKIQAKRKIVYKYEFGKPLDGLKLTYKYYGQIPSLEDFYTHVIPDSELKSDLENHITYLKVKCMNPASEVQVIYKPQKEKVVDFIIKNPVAMTTYTILAYSKEKKYPPFSLKFK